MAYQPAEGPAAGGDFYDVFALDERRAGIIVGDISGHGKKALEHTSLMRYTLRAYLDAGLEPRRRAAGRGPHARRRLERRLRNRGRGGVRQGSRHAHVLLGRAPAADLRRAGRVRARHLLLLAADRDDLHTGMRQTTVTLPRGTRACLLHRRRRRGAQERQMLGRDRLTQMVRELKPEEHASVLLRRARRRPTSQRRMAVCTLRVESRRAMRPFRLEELEAERTRPRGDAAARFMTACGLVPDRPPRRCAPCAPPPASSGRRY